MEEKINIAEILKDKKNGLRLYSPIFGECAFCCVRKDTNDICVKKHNGVKEFFDSKGFYYNTGEVMLFPSKSMRDWSKFAWKKRDVLVNEDGSVHIIFEDFENDAYTMFSGKYYYSKDGKKADSYFRECDDVVTEEFTIETEDAAQTYISAIEERLGGKLNLKTLEIEKQLEFKDGDILSCDEDSYTRHTTLILHKDENITESIVSLIRHKELVENVPINNFLLSRLYYAREDEKKELFDALAKEGKAWDSDKKAIVDLKPKVELKPFDKVLVRDGKDEIWEPAFFFRYLSQFSGYNYQTVGGEWRVYCIPYIGNESLLGTTKDMEC